MNIRVPQIKPKKIAGGSVGACDTATEKGQAESVEDTKCLETIIRCHASI